MITLELPFTRLDAKPAAIKDNLKSLIANPFLVSKKGSRPYIELDTKKRKVFPLERSTMVSFADKESRKAFKKLIQKSFDKEEFHAAHVEWIDRIRELWCKLAENKNYEIYKVLFERVSENKKRLEQLIGENLYEYRIFKKRTKNVIKQHKKDKGKQSNVTKAEKKVLKKKLELINEEIGFTIDKIRDA